MTPLDGNALLQLLPSLYRLRDAERGNVLARLLDVLAHPVQVLQEDLAQLYDDQFIETCADWVVPYIGDLIGYRQLNGVTAAISSPRAEVANTIHLRRGKGTVTVPLPRRRLMVLATSARGLLTVAATPLSCR